MVVCDRHRITKRMFEHQQSCLMLGWYLTLSHAATEYLAALGTMPGPRCAATSAKNQ